MVTNEAPILTMADNNSRERLPEKLSLKLRWRDRLRKAKEKFVVTKNEGRYSVSQPLALSLLGFMFVFGSAWYWRSTNKIDAQHDEIIRLNTLLTVAETKNKEQDAQIGMAYATAQNADRNLAELKGQFAQFSQIYAISNPRKGDKNE